MKFGNFDLLETVDKDLYKYAKDAEYYIYKDAQIVLIKLRCFAEKMVIIISKQLHISIDYNENLLDKMKTPVFVENIPNEILTKLHLLRMKGNKAAHGEVINYKQEELLNLLKETYLLGKWFYLQQIPDSLYPDYQIPFNIPSNNEEQEKQIIALKNELDKLLSNEEKIGQENKYLKTKLSEQQINLEREHKSSQYKIISDNLNLDNYHTLENISLMDCYNEYVLTEGQKVLIDKLSQFFNDKENNVFLLKGYAGTGKTFIMKGVSDYLSLMNRGCALIAPTGKAAKVLANKTGKIATTIHSKIYNLGDLIEYEDEENPNTYKFYANLKVNEDSSNNVYIIDESSMISDIYSDSEFIRFGSGYLLRDLMKYINLDQNNHTKKVIFIGDDAQLPPIGMNLSPALSSVYILDKFNIETVEYELTDVVRQKLESGVIKNALKIRDSIYKNEFNRLCIEFKNNDIHKINEKESIRTYLESCEHKINGESIVIAYSNADVNTYNMAIRQYFFPSQEIICKGDKVMAIRNREIDNLRISNGDFGLIRWVNPNNEERKITLRKKLKDGKIDTQEINLQFREVEIGFRNEIGHPVFIKTKIIENVLYSDCAQLSSEEQKALYIDFCIRNPELSYRKNRNEFKNALLADSYFNALPIKFGYAITCHKAQGSEWNNVIVKCDTHQNKLTKEYFRWFYTAITRTAKHLYLIDPPEISLGGNIKLVGDIGKKEKNKVVSTETQQVSYGIRLSKFNDLNDISKSIYNKIIPILTSLEVTEVNIEERPYHNIYSITYGDKTDRFRVFYNAKGKLTSITPINLSDNDIINKLKKLEGTSIPLSREYDANLSKIKFGKDFLNEFHQLVEKLFNENQIKIIQVEEKQYNLRYQIIKKEDDVVMDIYFNAKHQFTKLIIVKSSSQIFGNEVSSLITEGLS